MNIKEPLDAAIRSLRANKLRSALTALGIIIGVAAVIVVISLIQGLEKAYSNRWNLQVAKPSSFELALKEKRPRRMEPYSKPRSDS